MYLLNYLSLQAAQTRFIEISRLRAGMNLVGVRDGVNVTFRVPANEHYAHNLPFLTVQVYLNGMRLTLLDDYYVAESGGSGTGYDTILLTEAPYADDHLLADYVIA